MVDLLARTLNAMGEPTDDVRRFVGEDSIDVIQPGRGFFGITLSLFWRPVQVEAAGALVRNPSAIRDQAILDYHRLARGPGHLIDRAVAVQPIARLQLLSGRFSGVATRAFTLEAGHSSRLGTKMYSCIGM